MKRTLILMMVCIAVSITHAHGGDEHNALRGALTGAAFGALLGELDHAADPGITIPVFAGFGALAGYTWNQDGRRDHYSNHRRDNYYHNNYRYGRSRYGWRGPYAWYPRPVYYTSFARGSSRRKPKGDSRPLQQVVNRHPGVSLLTIPISLKNGMRVDITVFKLNDHYVGPKGERYDSLPTAEMLSLRYAQ